MLIKVTSRCSMGCSHCMEDATPDGAIMDFPVFLQALRLTLAIERQAREAMGYNLVMLSGGEPAEHPEIERMIEAVREHGLQPILLSNGLWLADEGKREAILGTDPKLIVQVTNDPRFYPKAPPIVDDPRVKYVDSLTHMIPLGRFAGKMHPAIPTKTAPACFNLRSITRSTGDIEAAVFHLRLNSLRGVTGHCTPSVTPEGRIVVGESRLCYQIGNVATPLAVLTLNVQQMPSCNLCGLESNLQGQFRQAILG